MSVIVAILVSFLCAFISGCLSHDTVRPVYGVARENEREFATIKNSVSGDRFLKDRFILRSVGGQRTALGSKPENEPLYVHSGEQRMELAFLGFKNGLGNAAIAANADCVFSPRARGSYIVRGKVEGDVATLWIEESESATAVTEKVTAGIVPMSQFDPLRRY